MKKTGLMAAFALAATIALGSVYGAAVSAGTAPRSGDRMPDGTVYVDVSPDTHKPFYTTPADAPGVYTQNKATEYCSALQALGHHDWRLPTKNELNVEFNNRAAIGGFDSSDRNTWYWSSSRRYDGYDAAWAQRFSDGNRTFLNSSYFDDFSLRCVR